MSDGADDLRYALGHAARERTFGVGDLALQRSAIDLRERAAAREQRTGDEQ